jgi:hypothetical protein
MVPDLIGAQFERSQVMRFGARGVGREPIDIVGEVVMGVSVGVVEIERSLINRDRTLEESSLVITVGPHSELP